MSTRVDPWMVRHHADKAIRTGRADLRAGIVAALEAFDHARGHCRAVLNDAPTHDYTTSGGLVLRALAIKPGEIVVREPLYIRSAWRAWVLNAPAGFSFKVKDDHLAVTATNAAAQDLLPEVYATWAAAREELTGDQAVDERDAWAHTYTRAWLAKDLASLRLAWRLDHYYGMRTGLEHSAKVISQAAAALEVASVIYQVPAGPARAFARAAHADGWKGTATELYDTACAVAA